MRNYTITLLVSLLTLASLSGCIRRRMTVRTNPPGAAVYVDNQYVGSSPTATATTYYGTREIQVVRDGYRTERILRRFNPPWYQLPPIDFVTDVLWPKKIRDERIVDITMVPQQVMSSEELAGRANTLRMQAARGIATPLPPTLNPGVGGMESQPIYPAPINPNAPVPPEAIVTQPSPNPYAVQPPWQPGQWLREFVAPGGNPPTRIPEAGILQGGGYRPEVEPLPSP